MANECGSSLPLDFARLAARGGDGGRPAASCGNVSGSELPQSGEGQSRLAGGGPVLRLGSNSPILVAAGKRGQSGHSCRFEMRCPGGFR